MKSIITISILLLFSGSALAEWLQIKDFVGKGRDVKVFVDTDNINREGDRATMWTLTNYASPMEVGNKEQLSSKTLEEYDCKNNQYRTLAVYWYSERDAEGDLVYEETAPGTMQPILEKSAIDMASKIACGKK